MTDDRDDELETQRKRTTCFKHLVLKRHLGEACALCDALRESRGRFEQARRLFIDHVADRDDYLSL